jgi:hypothetical protein
MDIVYNPNNEMNPLLWGPQMWNILHIISFNYPNEPTSTDKKNYYNFITNLQNILPTYKVEIINTVDRIGSTIAKISNVIILDDEHITVVKATII